MITNINSYLEELRTAFPKYEFVDRWKVFKDE